MPVSFASASDGFKYTEYCQEKNVCVVVLTYTQRSQRMHADMRREKEKGEKN